MQARRRIRLSRKDVATVNEVNTMATAGAKKAESRLLLTAESLRSLSADMRASTAAFAKPKTASRRSLKSASAPLSPSEAKKLRLRMASLQTKLRSHQAELDHERLLAEEASKALQKAKTAAESVQLLNFLEGSAKRSWKKWDKIKLVLAAILALGVLVLGFYFLYQIPQITEAAKAFAVLAEQIGLSGMRLFAGVACALGALGLVATGIGVLAGVGLLATCGGLLWKLPSTATAVAAEAATQGAPSAAQSMKAAQQLNVYRRLLYMQPGLPFG